ncbi:MAG: class I SAM-dependent methyltransferase [Spirochaetales bacterium]|nr:class I SAM-dependent methyltransferase [Spirochaetales bacterium]
MRSSHADYFNHDGDAPGYDRDVADETNPVRAGYRALIDFVGARTPPDTDVLDLGAGTGNTVLALPLSCRVTAVDVSEKMLALAAGKLAGRNTAFIQDDILSFVHARDLAGFHVLVSTYALHHLTPGERGIMFRTMFEKTRPAVKIIIGDIMYKNDDDRNGIIEKYQVDYPDLASDFTDEFFWNVDESDADLKRSGWNAEWRRFSDLSWTVELVKT